MHLKVIDGVTIFTADHSTTPSKVLLLSAHRIWASVDAKKVAHTALDWFGLFSVVAIPFIAGVLYALSN